MQLTLSGRVRLMHAALEWIPGNAPFKHLFSHLLMQNMRWMVSSGISIPLLRYLLICWPKAVLRSGKRQNSASTCTRSAIALACRLAARPHAGAVWALLGPLAAQLGPMLTLVAQQAHIVVLQVLHQLLALCGLATSVNALKNDEGSSAPGSLKRHGDDGASSSYHGCEELKRRASPANRPGSACHANSTFHAILGRKARTSAE